MASRGRGVTSTESPLALSKADLLDGVGRKWVGCGDERGLGAVPILVSHVGHVTSATLRERKTGNGGRNIRNISTQPGFTRCRSIETLRREVLPYPLKPDSPEATIDVALALHSRCAARLHVDAILSLELISEPSAVGAFLTLGQDGDMSPVVRAPVELGCGSGSDGQAHEESL